MYGRELPDNTFSQDFGIAEKFGEKAIRETYEACQEWQDDVEMYAALVVTLNHRIWSWYGNNDRYARIYDELWKKAHHIALTKLTGENARIYFELTD